MATPCNGQMYIYQLENVVGRIIAGTGCPRQGWRTSILELIRSQESSHLPGVSMDSFRKATLQDPSKTTKEEAASTT